MVLGTGLFEAIDALGLGRVLTGEKGKDAVGDGDCAVSPSARGIACDVRPRLLPVLAQSSAARFRGLASGGGGRSCGQRGDMRPAFCHPVERRLINVLRAGIAGAVPKRARLPVQLVIT